MLLTDKKFLIDVIDNIYGVGALGKKLLKALVYINEDNTTPQRLCELVGSNAGSVSKSLERLVDKNFVIKEGKYKGCSVKLNEKGLEQLIDLHTKNSAIKKSLENYK